MNLKTAALRLGVHYQTAYRWVRSGQLVAVKVGAGYEISDAAVARLQAQRAATGRTPERADAGGPTGPADRADALHLLDLMVDAVSLDAAAVAARAARVAAEHLGDTAYLYRRNAGGDPMVEHAAHADPVSEVAAMALGRDPRTPDSLARRAFAGGEVVYVPQVSQLELRRRLHPELHEHLHLCGCYSAVSAPIGVTGVLLVTRDTPGRPYTPDDIAFVEAITARVAIADERARSWTEAWAVRRAMVAELAEPHPDGGCFDAVLARIAPGPAAPEPAMAVLDVGLRHVAYNKSYEVLIGGGTRELADLPLRALVRDALALDDALAAVLLGEIDYRSVELELAHGSRVALHLGMARRPDATPRGLALVAHGLPPLAASCG